MSNSIEPSLHQYHLVDHIMPPPWEDDLDLERTFRSALKVISVLDQFRRWDLGIPLRKIVDQMGARGEFSQPNPFLLRKLYAEAQEAWCAHIVDTERRSAPEAQEKIYWLRCGRIAGASFSGCDMTQRVGISNVDHPLRFEFGTTTYTDNRRLKEIYELLEICGELPSDSEDQRIIDARWDRNGAAHIIGSETHSFSVKVFGLPATLDRRYFFHGGVDIDNTLIFEDETLANEFRLGLKKLIDREVSPAALELASLVKEKGECGALDAANVPCEMDAPEARSLMAKYDLKKREFASYFREERQEIAGLCHRSGMTVDDLVRAAGRFWDNLDARLANVYPGIQQ